LAGSCVLAAVLDTDAAAAETIDTIPVLGNAVAILGLPAVDVHAILAMGWDTSCNKKENIEYRTRNAEC
jgi:hypothetical protein